jgi:hypothetical protein
MQKLPTFSQIVCSTPLVRMAYDSHPLLRVWWRTILWLHGKPIEASLEPSTQRLQQGFRFYARLYGLLALVLFGVGAALLTANQMAADTIPFYWIATTLGASGFVGVTSSVGRQGANQYGTNASSAAVLLVTFFVMVLCFLTFFLTTVSFLIHTTSALPVYINLGLTMGLMFFGAGSYLIEMVYLLFSNSSCINDIIKD